MTFCGSQMVLVGSGNFDAQMSGIKISKCDEILRPAYKKPFSEKLSGCLHFGPFGSVVEPEPEPEP